MGEICETSYKWRKVKCLTILGNTVNRCVCVTTICYNHTTEYNADSRFFSRQGKNRNILDFVGHNTSAITTQPRCHAGAPWQTQMCGRGWEGPQVTKQGGGGIWPPGHAGRQTHSVLKMIWQYITIYLKFKMQNNKYLNILKLYSKFRRKKTQRVSRLNI